KENGVGAGEPTVSGKLEVIVFVLGDEFRMLWRTAPDAVTDVEDYKAIAPVGEIDKPIHHLEVMEETAARKHAVNGLDGDGSGVGLPARYFFRVLGILKVDDAQGAGGVVIQVDIVSVDVGAVDSAGDG